MIQIFDFGQVSEEEIFSRKCPTADVTAPVADIIARVRREGDAALYDYARKFDGAELSSLAVTQEELDAAFDAVEPEFLSILREAADNIRAFHEKQRHTGFVLTEKEGVVLGQRVMPIERVGLCVPGGTAAYPSTVLMDSIPAKLAGVPELIMVTPPNEDGTLDPVILAAAKLAGVDKIFKVGGAQAVAALAYGTESIPRVDKIVGPGGAFVAEAKRQVFGQVAIDMVAGPSEILVLADGNNDPRVLAADMLSQAEHDKNASAVLVTDSRPLALAVQEELERQLALLPRSEIARASVEENGKIIVCDDLTLAVDIANRLAPEHIELCVDDPFSWLPMVKNAGSVFLGRSCPEALGDYFAGTNHTLPTGGAARFSSPLSVDEFVKKSQFIYYSAEALDAVADKVAYFAEKEGLDAHARSAKARSEAV